MDIEIIQGPTIVQKIAGQPCKECEEDKLQKTLQEENLAQTDRVSLSGESPLKTANAADSAETGSNKGLDNSGEKDNAGAASQAGPRTEAELSPEEKQALDDLKARDREVRAHEQAHLAAAGPYAKGPPSFEFQTGPDGQSYAVGGEVQIDTSPVAGNPQATVVKAQTIKRAATAPANPSAQDRQVAAQAARMETEARQEIKEQRTEKQEQTTGQSNPAGPIENTAVSIQNTQPASESAPAGQGRSVPRNSDSNSRVQNLLQNFASSPTADKGNLLDIVS
jgi:SprA-related family